MCGRPRSAIENRIAPLRGLFKVSGSPCSLASRSAYQEIDADDWATETMGNPRYPLELFQRFVTVSLETCKIVAGLPPLDI